MEKSFLQRIQLLTTLININVAKTLREWQIKHASLILYSSSMYSDAIPKRNVVLSIINNECRSKWSFCKSIKAPCQIMIRAHTTEQWERRDLVPVSRLTKAQKEWTENKMETLMLEERTTRSLSLLIDLPQATQVWLSLIDSWLMPEQG